GTTANVADIILGASVGFGVVTSPPGSPWTAQALASSDFCTAGWQIPAFTGAFTYNTATSSGAADWSAGIVAVSPGGGATAHSITLTVSAGTTGALIRQAGK